MSLTRSRPTLSGKFLRPTPWDSAALGIPTWELLAYSEEALAAAVTTAGHHSIKVDPLADKDLLNRYGFYYCDTLLEPWCTKDRLRPMLNKHANIAPNDDVDAIVAMCADAFVHGRFHRDPQVHRAGSEQRYERWARQLCVESRVFALYWQNARAGFIACNGTALVLHAVAPEFRGRGLARFWWSAVCGVLFEEGADEVRSSISAGNMGALNLYASLGFAFRRPCDAYHFVASD